MVLTEPAPTAEPAACEGVLRRHCPRESAARTYARALPVVPVRARGLTVEAADGRRYLDCLSGAGVLALGHNHPVVLEAVRAVLDSGAPLQVLDLATPVKDAFVEELLACLPPALAAHGRIRFCGPAGTDAVQAALGLVRAATGRPGVLAFSGASHGTTTGAPAVSGGIPPADTCVSHLPYPHSYRCPFGVGGDRGAGLSARLVQSVLDDPGHGVPLPAGVVLEPVQGEAGVIPAPDAWLRRMRQLTAARDLPLVVDEVQTGVGRTGAFWGVDHAGVVPDVMVLSGAVGGSLPLAAIVHHEDLDAGAPGAPTGTFRGNQLAMAAGRATLAHVRRGDLAAHAAGLGARMLRSLRELPARHRCVGDVRGRGLMIGVEIVDPEAADTTGAPPPAPELALAVQQACLQRGLIVELGGPHHSVVRLLPPLTLTDEQADAVLDRLADAVEATARTPRPPARVPHPTLRGTTR
ncbi:diaminobutyrate--2-oxoglutarate transaminase family protein [Streptomyces sp. NPDC059740]|uniref:diaminobutyrate--2-oxoglutarate transaminase family protein n=1 Tax=Streptomyces sp. NPDC059740 TaxID=3346926 RepID=UPI0036659EC5